MKATFSIEGTSDELRNFFKGRGFDFGEMVKDVQPIIVVGDQGEPDFEKIEQAFESMSWDSFYLTHIIFVKAGGQSNKHGRFLTLDQLVDYGISERSVGSRVGGVKRLSKRLNINYLLFTRKRRDGKGKNYYMSNEYVQYFQRLLDKNDEEYREFLEDEELEYPAAG